MEALKWLQDLMDMIIKWIPKPTIIKSTHGAVAFVRGKARKVKSGCWYWYWPIWTEVYELEITHRTMIFPVQGILAADGGDLVPMSVVAGIRFQVFDWFKALTLIEDVDSRLENLGQAAVKKGLSNRNLQDLYTDPTFFALEIYAGLRDRFAVYGIAIDELFFKTLTTAKQINLMGIPEALSISNDTSVTREE